MTFFLFGDHLCSGPNIEHTYSSNFWRSQTKTYFRYSGGNWHASISKRGNSSKTVGNHCAKTSQQHLARILYYAVVNGYATDLNVIAVWVPSFPWVIELQGTILLSATTDNITKSNPAFVSTLLLKKKLDIPNFFFFNLHSPSNIQSRYRSCPLKIVLALRKKVLVCVFS